jgi:ketosteroid isomerase-like protein
MSTIDSKPDWVDGLFACIDRKDTAGFLEFLSDDVEFCFGSAPAVTGKKATGDAIGAFFDSIAGLSHSLSNVWAGSESFVCEGSVHYSRHDNSDVTLPFVSVFDMNGDRIRGYRIYIDIGPLYAS